VGYITRKKIAIITNVKGKNTKSIDSIENLSYEFIDDNTRYIKKSGKKILKNHPSRLNLGLKIISLDILTSNKSV
jgi:hypothetical protein